MSTHLGAARRTNIFGHPHKTAAAKHRKSAAKTPSSACTIIGGEVRAKSPRNHAAAGPAAHTRKAAGSSAAGKAAAELQRGSAKVEPRLLHNVAMDSEHATRAAQPAVHMRKAAPAASPAATPARKAHKRALAAAFALLTAASLALSWALLQPGAQIAAQLEGADVVLTLTANSTSAGASTAAAASASTATSAASATVDAAPAISGAQAFAAQMAAYATAQSAADNTPAATQFATITAGHTLTAAAAARTDDATCLWQVYAPTTGTWVALPAVAQNGEGVADSAASGQSGQLESTGEVSAEQAPVAASAAVTEPAATATSFATNITCQLSATNLSTYLDTQNGATIRALVTQSGAQYTSEILYVTVEPAITDLPAA